MRNVSDKSCTENQNTHFLFNNSSFENRAFIRKFEKKKCTVGRPQMTTWRTHIACWIPKATDIFSEYVIRTPFLQQQWLNEGATILRYTYTACLVNSNNIQ